VNAIHTSVSAAQLMIEVMTKLDAKGKMGFIPSTFRKKYGPDASIERTNATSTKGKFPPDESKHSQNARKLVQNWLPRTYKKNLKGRREEMS